MCLSVATHTQAHLSHTGRDQGQHEEEIRRCGEGRCALATLTHRRISPTQTTNRQCLSTPVDAQGLEGEEVGQLMCGFTAKAYIVKLV